MSNLERAAKYIATMEPGHEGERNQRGFRVAAVLRNDFALGDADAWPLLRSWNERNVPPLGERELRAIFDSAGKHAKGAPGAKADAPRKTPAHSTNGSEPRRAQVVATYPYRDAAGALLFEVVRFAPKDFRQRRPDGNGGYIWNLNGTPRVLYRLQELLAADPAQWVFVCEGEKDVENLHSLGLTATTNPGGAGKWGKLSDDSALHGRRVAVIPDGDKPGEAHAQDVAARLQDNAAEVKIVDLPGAGKDASDLIAEWRKEGHAEAAIGSAFLGLADAAPAWMPPSIPTATVEDSALAMLFPNPRSVRDLLKTFPTLRPPVIHGLLRQGETMNVISSPKVGKSWLVTDLALSLATGRPWLGFETVAGDALIIDNELHGETIAGRIPRVATAREIQLEEIADRVFVENLRGKLQDLFAMGDYFHALEPGRFKLIVLDAFYRFLPRDSDENDNGTMANIYNAIDSYADYLGCSFVLIHHTTKGVQSNKSITDVGAGAGAQARATDTHLILRPHEENDVVVLDAAVRSWAPVKPRCLRWTFPVWQLADDLNPADLRPERPRKKKVDAPPPADPWTVERFVSEVLGPDGRATKAVIGDAKTRGLTGKHAEQLLALAVDKHLAFCATGSASRARLYSTTKPPETGSLT